MTSLSIPARDGRGHNARKFVFVGLCLAGVGWFIWPYYDMLKLLNALTDGDVVVLENQVDWEAVRQGIRSDIKSDVIGFSKRSEDNFGSDLADMLGSLYIDRMIDSYVTPQGAAREFRGSQINKFPIHYAFFSGPFAFKVIVKAPNQSKEITAFFKWTGTWKLVHVH